MRDAAGELADRLHLLRLEQLGREALVLSLDFLAGRDVAEVDDQALDARLLEEIRDHSLDPATGSVRSNKPALKRHSLPRLSQAFSEVLLGHRPVVGVDRGQDVERDTFFGRVTGLAENRGAGVDGLQICVEYRDFLRTVFDQRAEALDAGLECLLRSFPFADVLSGAFVAENLPLAIADVFDIHGKPANAADPVLDR